MQVDLLGQTALLAGAGDGVAADAETADAIAAALLGNGASVARASAEESLAAPAAFAQADLLLLIHGLRPDQPASALPLSKLAEAYAAVRTSGRLVLVSSALGGLAMRRYPEVSVVTAAAAAEIRVLAMRLAPKILVNGIGAGAIQGAAGDYAAGSAAMLSHVPSGKAGTVSDIVNAVLFLCDPLNTYMTGQILMVDGGWMAGYGRNF